MLTPCAGGSPLSSSTLQRVRVRLTDGALGVVAEGDAEAGAPLLAGVGDGVCDVLNKEVASTEMFCVEPEGVMDQEDAISRALESATTYVIEGDRLTLRTAEDAIAIELNRDERPSLADESEQTARSY